MYFATKDSITKQIQKQDRYLYENLGWTITTDGNNPYDPYDYNDVNAKGNCLQPIIINGETFNGYSAFSCINTKTYVVEPERTNDGSIPNIKEADTFIVPRVTISFKYMTIDDFRRFLKAITPNEFKVTYYDYETDKMVTYNMYCQPREMSNIFNKGYEILAITDQEINLVATLNDMNYVTLNYYDNEIYVDSQTGQSKYYLLDTKEMLYGNDYVIDSGANFIHNNAEVGYTYTLSKWNTQPNGKGTNYAKDSAYTAITDLVLFAQWDKTLTTYSISYNMNGGTNNASNPQTFNIESETIVLANPTKSGATFGGWYSDSTFKEQIFEIEKGTAENVIVYAKWE